VRITTSEELREQALRLGAIPVSRHRDREQVRAIIRIARSQWSGRPADD
jgi:hypothetical protein